MPKIKFNTYEQALNYVNSLSIQQMVEGYARLLCETEVSKVEPVRLTQEQFNAYFKIVGLNKNGEVERRGRKKKD